MFVADSHIIYMLYIDAYCCSNTNKYPSLTLIERKISSVFRVYRK